MTNADDHARGESRVSRSIFSSAGPGSAVVGKFRAAMGCAVVVLCLAVTEGRANVSCFECHQDQSLTLERDGREVSLFVDEARLASSRHGELSCTDCHADVDGETLPHREAITPVNCLECHSDLADTHVFHPGIGGLTQLSTAPELACASCHDAHEMVAKDDPAHPFAAARGNEACGACHETELKHFRASAHTGDDPQLFPDCLRCHRQSVVGANGTRLDAKLAQSRLCLSCHVEVPATAARTRLSGRFVASWQDSVHAQALERGEAGAASCVDCHGSHEMQRAMVADSRVHKLHITETCQRCHERQAADYTSGVHHAALRRGAWDSPVCTDCHGEHLILAAGDPQSPVAALNVSRQLCGDCHGSVRLSEKYGLATDRFETFADSFHGLAAQGGLVEVANCASCHGAHGILPSTDPASPVHKANLAQTCGQCHPKANERFAVGAVHVSLSPNGNGKGHGGGDEVTAVSVVATIYVWLIVVIVGGMLLHNGADFLKKVRLKVHGHRTGVGPAEAVPHRLHLRMTLNERLQHGLLALSFVVLVVTGFMLRFPEAWWVQALRSLSLHLFEWRGWLHRAAAVALAGSGLWHLIYVVGTQRGRDLIRDLLPRRRDFRDAWQVLRFNLGLGRTKPAFGRFSYIEKTEYWAMLWGSILMSVTGVLLWADDTTMGLLTKLGFDLARVVHVYEAVLATLAIIVWHFYFVIFNPDVYPMNLSWLTGYLSEEEMATEHGAELERLKALEAPASESEGESEGAGGERESDGEREADQTDGS